MPRILDHERLGRDLLRYLSSRGAASGAEAARSLEISQPAFSRLARKLGRDLLVTGRARAVRYAAYREIPDVGRRIPIYEIDESGSSRHIAMLHATRPNGFFVEALVDDVQSGRFDDLPYFLHDLRPAGFLGRLLPRRHPELGAPDNIQLWTANDSLGYLTRYGWNLSGNIIVGDEAFRLYLTNRTTTPAIVADELRSIRYAGFADDVLSAGPPGSSAAGEQPKFIVSRFPGPVEVMVKFSPPLTNPLSQRIADLLVAEHVCHGVLASCGHESARSEIIEGGNRVFLEIERFDRTALGGRRGLLSLFALDAGFVGRLNTWTDSARHLEAHQRISPAVGHEIAWRELFGRLIANTDMHAGNLSFVTRGTRVVGLAPVYDMLPMMYAPQQTQLPQVRFVAPMPDPAHGSLWASAHAAAIDFWTAVRSHPRVSPDFQEIATTNIAVLRNVEGVAALLPGAAHGAH